MGPGNHILDTGLDHSTERGTLGDVPAFPGTMDVSILRSRQTEPTAHAAVDNFAE